MKEVINYGEARRQQILKGFATADEAADEPIEKARHGVYADNAQNRRLQRVGQEYGQAAKEDPEGEGQEGGMPEGNVSLQNHARQASEEALTKVANDPQADPEMRKVATAELERRGVNVRAKNKNGDTSLRNGLADGDAKSASTFEGMGFRQMDDQDLQQYAGVEDASHAFIKQIGGDEDGFDLVVTKTSEGYRVDKYPYADVDNFESVTVKEIGDVEGAASKFGDPDAKGKGGKADAASLVDSFNAMAEGDVDFDAKSFKSFVKEKGGKAVKEIADADKFIKKSENGANPSEYAKMISKNPEGIARVLKERIASGDKAAKRAALSLTSLIDPESREKGVGQELLSHPELKKIADERAAAHKLLTGVSYDDMDTYKKKSDEQIEIFKRTNKEFVDKFLEIYGGNTEE